MKRRPPKNNKRLVRSSGINIRRFFVNNDVETTQGESHGEFGYALRLLRNRRIAKVISQGIVLEFVDKKGKKHTYTPDFLVYLKSGEIEIHEVTLTSRRTKLEIQRREAAARKICEEKGWRLVIVAENEFPGLTEWANLDFLYCFKAESCKISEIFEAVLKHIPQDSSPVFAERFTQQISESISFEMGEVRKTLYYMLWHCILDTNIEKLIAEADQFRPQTQIWLNKEE
jgi:hypothetical protein